MKTLHNKVRKFRQKIVKEYVNCFTGEIDDKKSLDEFYDLCYNYVNKNNYDIDKAKHTINYEADYIKWRIEK